jgi:Zn-dependent protease with chaperone function
MRGRLQALGALHCTLIVGVVLAGIPAGILVNLIAVAVSGGDFMSPRNAIDLTLTLALVAPTVGALFGRRIFVGNNRALADAWNASAPAEPATAPPPSMHHEDDTLAAYSREVERLMTVDPDRLKARVIRMTALGYLYVIGVLSLVIGAIVLVVVNAPTLQRATFHLVLALGALAFFLLSALWVRVEKPAGILITRAGSPALFDMLAALAASLRAPLPDEVLLTNDLNACVLELPRYGIFGPSRRYLAIGLPLLEAFPVAQVRFILAHEMAHLARQHSQGTLSLARLTVTWTQVATSLQAGRHWARGAFLPFFRWYAPRLELLHRHLSRVDEFEADAIAAKASGAPDAANALLRLHVMQRHLAEAVLPAILRRSSDLREPPHDVAERLAAGLREPPGSERVSEWARQELADETLERDTHPSVYRRIERLMASSDRERMLTSFTSDFQSSSESAADTLLGKARLSKLRQRLGEAWQLEMLDSWNAWHAQARLWRDTGPSPTAGEDLEVAWARASWAAACESPSVAIGLLEDYLQRDGQRNEATVALGTLLLRGTSRTEREEGVRLLEAALQRDSLMALNACAALEGWYTREGEEVATRRVRARRRQLEQDALAGSAERVMLSPDDAMTAHPLHENTVAVIRRLCAAEPRVRWAHVVRKRVRYLADDPCVFLVVEPDVAWYKPAMGALHSEIATELWQRLARENISDISVIGCEIRGGLSQAVRVIPGSEVYRKPGTS